MTTLTRFAALSAVAALAACNPAPYEQPDTGVGFGSYTNYQAQREAALAGNPIPSGVGPVNAYGQPTTTTYGAPIGTTAPVATAGGLPASVVAAVDAVQPGAQPALPQPGAALPATTGAVDPATGLATTAPAGTPLEVDNAGISDENDFAAVSQRETIESDKARIEANKQNYVQIQPGELPERTGGGNVSPIIEYAINAPNRLGEPIYQRGGLTLGSSDKACLKFSSPAAAQEAFLNAGGPKRDPKNLDPDGDGFACSWDPTPFQKARG